MGLIKFKPTTASSRHTRLAKLDRKDYGANSAESKQLKKKAAKRIKGLTTKLAYKAGRNNSGKLATRHKGGREKRVYRIVDFKRDKKDIVAKVVNVEYDPYRSAHIALLQYADGEKRYIIAPNGLTIGAEVVASDKFESPKPGNAHPIGQIPAATFVHNVELVAGKGGVLARSAGVGIQIQGRADKGYIQLKMPSGEIRLVKEDCYATIGTVGNLDYTNEKVGKAGRSRRRGIKPTVRGVAQSYKHPHGGGQGKSGRHGTGGPAKDPWGNKRGAITRKNKTTNKFIVKRRTSTLRPRNKPYKTIA
jgi:large subunit ribosomal protein L2